MFKLLISMGLFCYLTTCLAIDVPIEDFPITYSQNAKDYLPEQADNYKKALLTREYQQLQLKKFYKHYYSDEADGLSPWSSQMVSVVLPLAKEIETKLLDEFNNTNQMDAGKHYAENFKEQSQLWWANIKENMDLSAIEISEFNEANRAITVNNTYARALPDMAPDLLHLSRPGGGFPFDNLQESAIWAGTPLYVVSVTKNKAWSFVITPDGYFAWVKSHDLAYTSPEFIQTWQQAAQNTLIAVTQTEVSILNKQQQFQFTGYIGAVFPMIQRGSDDTSIMIPVKNNNNQATIQTGLIATHAATIMPLTASPQNFVKIINQLKNRPYGWGGAFFFNDCSQETKSLLTPFAIWLPRNSAKQTKFESSLDLSALTMDERMRLLKEKGHALLTLIYVNGHIMFYIGEAKIENQGLMPMTYQNMWGMIPENRDKRYVVGQSVFWPLLKNYPQRPEVMSQMAKPIFKLVYLDQLNTTPDTASVYAQKFFKAYIN